MDAYCCPNPPTLNRTPPHMVSRDASLRMNSSSEILSRHFSWSGLSLIRMRGLVGGCAEQSCITAEAALKNSGEVQLCSRVSAAKRAVHGPAFKTGCHDGSMLGA